MHSCIYCGDHATDRDHITPHSYVSNSKNRSFKEYWEWSCSECNTVLANILLTTVEERGHYLHNKISKRYAKLLSSPPWTDEEIDDLGPGLRASILSARIERYKVEDRLRYLSKYL